MDLLIRDVDRSIVQRFTVLAAVAGQSREQFIRELLASEFVRREAVRVAMATNASADVELVELSIAAPTPTA